MGFWDYFFITLSVVLIWAKRAAAQVTPEQKEQAAHGFTDFLNRTFR